VVAGGGVAALETALAVHELAEDRATVTLLTPNDRFGYRPIGVFEPFLHRPVRPADLLLTEFAKDVGARLETESLTSVDSDVQMLRTASGRELSYDVLVIATGARVVDVFPAALTINPSAIGQSLRAVIRDIQRGSVRSLGIIVPSRLVWPLPAYELAFLVKERAREQGIDLRVSVLTSEEAPLEIFGDVASEAVADVLFSSGITTRCGVHVEVERPGEVIIYPGQEQLLFDCLVALPELRGPAITGLPSDPFGFLSITPHAALSGIEHVYVAGDATDFPVKQGGISAQQADAAAESIAAMCGVTLEPRPFDTTVRGMLLTSRKGRYLYLSARLEGDVVRDSTAGEAPMWWPTSKIAARYLSTYLDTHWGVHPPGDTNWHAWSLLRLVDADD
jgi:sulfide:quinone oxidoreductase